MRVLHVLPTLTGSGAEGLVAALVPCLREEGVRCGVMTIYPSEIPFGPGVRSAVDVLEIDRRGRYDPAFFPRMVARMRSWRPDVVHTHMHNGKYWGRLAAFAIGAPTIVHTEHLPCDTKRTVGEPIADRLLNAASTAVVTFLEEQRHFLCAFEGIAPSKVVVIPNGIEHAPPPAPSARIKAREDLRLPNGSFVIFVVGTLCERKNQRLAIEALGIMPTHLRERVRVCIVGEGSDKGALEALTRARGLDGNVTFLGRRSDVTSILPAADLVFMPSLSEGMPLALLEAMSAGVPVLSTAWIGARGFLEGGNLGTVATGWDPVSIATDLERIMNDNSPLRSVAARAQARVREEYDIKLTAKRYRDLYRSLLEQRAA
jgi:glycosyltransferase involved in cell wall biosynthesis